MQSLLLGTAAVLVVAAVISGLAEHRRRHRKDMDKVGVVNWQFLQFLALLGAAIAAYIAFRMQQAL